jgi:NTP pyrophosphatase (non-canonical NTP hydrolase)
MQHHSSEIRPNGQRPNDEAVNVNTTLEDLVKAIDAFAAERDWDQFHTPKNLAGSILIESGELMEVIQWDSPSFDELVSDERRTEKVKEELADILNYILRFCSLAGFDPISIVSHKLKINGEKYPVEKSKGSSKKYDEL